MKMLLPVIVTTFAASASVGSENKSVVTPVLTTDVTAAGQPFTFPAKNAQVVVATYEIPSGAALP